MNSAKGIIGASHNEGIAVADIPSRPSPEILEKLRQLKEEAEKRIAQQDPKDANTLAWQQSNAFKRIYPKANGGQIDMDRMRLELMNGGGKAKFLKDSHVKHRVYHGTASDFSVFNTTRSGEFGPAIYTTDSPREASEYGEGQQKQGVNVMPLYISLKNPYKKGVDAFWKEFGKDDSDAAAVERAKAAGYDGVIAQRADDYYDNATKKFVSTGKKLNHYIAFHPHQIKSAIGNRGTYDITNPDITKAEGGEVDYRGEHTAPGPHYGAPLHDVSSNGMYPSDFYGNNGRRYYANEGWDFDNDAYNKVTRVKNKPNAMVSIHRAVPTSVYKEALKKEAPLKHMIRKGDWVAINKEYARAHGESVLNGDYKIASMRVPAKHVWTNADSIHEWGYHPEEEKKANGGITHAHHLDIEERPL